MALHFTPLKTPTPMTSSIQSARRTPQPATRSATTQVHRPESATQQSFQSVATSTTSAPQNASTELTGLALFQAMFPDMGGTNVAAPTAPVAPGTGAPTAESVFGPSPWLANPTGLNPDGSTYSFNPQYFATPQTAAEVAQMVGGTVVQVNEMTPESGPYQQQQPNQMVQLKNGALINPGLVAGFYTHGYPQSFVDQMITNEVTNSTPNT
jgi:hypothetical protein